MTTEPRPNTGDEPRTDAVRNADGSYDPPGNKPPMDVLVELQRLCDAGHLRVTRMWCSEIGYYDLADENLGHFHGKGAIHLPVTFKVNPDPGDGVGTERPPPFTFKLRVEPPDA